MSSATDPTAPMQQPEQEQQSEASTNEKLCSTGGIIAALPPWKAPQPTSTSFITGLKVLNSLTRQPELLVTATGDARLTWYMCGPTVYAPSHMGHARTYLGFDIIRRILEQYFNYHVTLIMNITDIDDKIIDRSNEMGCLHTELSRRFEMEFHSDMADLGVAPPTVLTRVTEYMPEITAYIQRLVNKGMAYESNGSVYFDTAAFSAQPDFYYGKLAPEQIGNTELLAEGEGKAAAAGFADEKKQKTDFALWKKCKPGEPSWESEWGPGRPGWHIECSVMASDILRRLTGQPCMDLHSGGVDLKFPHHDNEMAQAEAECDCHQWVNYFIHSGHLHIKGLKMSKSLKNFITIQQALEINSARQIRMLFLLHKYNAKMDYGDNTMSHALEAEKKFVEFFHNVKACLRQQGGAGTIGAGKANSFLQAPQKWNDETIALQRVLEDVKLKVDAALKDDFDTKTAMNVLSDLVRATNVYMMEQEGSGGVVGLVVRNVADYITRMFKIFGLIFSDTIGFPPAAEVSKGTGGMGTDASVEETLGPVLDALMEFRSSVREKARTKDATGVLQECDDFRDNKLPPLGIRLEDKATGSVWKLADPAELILEMQQRQAEAERKAQEKEEKAAEAAKKETLNKLSPADYMRQLTLEDGTTLMYSQFDETGMPTHDNNNEPLNKNQSKKAQKLFKAQEQKYEKYLKSQEK